MMGTVNYLYHGLLFRNPQSQHVQIYKQWTVRQYSDTRCMPEGGLSLHFLRKHKVALSIIATQILWTRITPMAPNQPSGFETKYLSLSNTCSKASIYVRAQVWQLAAPRRPVLGLTQYILSQLVSRGE